METPHAPSLARVSADIDALRQARDRLHAELSHLLEVIAVWRAERDRLRAEVAALREAQCLCGGCTPDPVAIWPQGYQKSDTPVHPDVP